MQALREATYDQLICVEGIGQIIAENVVAYFQDERNQDFISRLTAAGVQMELPEEQKLSDALSGKSIVISGTFSHHSREEYKALIEQHGGKNVSSISKKTSFILAGENMGPSKLEKAQKLGIPLMSEDDFLAMLQ